MTTPAPKVFPFHIGVDLARGHSRSAVVLFDEKGKVVAECESNSVTEALVAEVGRLRRRVDELERERVTDPERGSEEP